MSQVTYKYTGGGEVLPDGNPVVEWKRVPSKHDFDVFHEVVNPINPTDGNQLQV